VLFRTQYLSKCVLVVCACSYLPPACASSISFAGNFATDDNIVAFGFVLSSAETVTLETLSFSGGVGVSGLVASGGFSPVLSLFDPNDNLLAYDLGATAPTCGAGNQNPNAPPKIFPVPPRNIDPYSGYCLDAYINLSLNAGDYTLALTQDDNLPLGDFNAGFSRQDSGNFTASELGLDQGAFLLFDGTQRTSAWEIDFLGVDSAYQAPVPELPFTIQASVPEPRTNIAAGLGFGLLFLTRRVICCKAS
jgi:hypothetical protein